MKEIGEREAGGPTTSMLGIPITTATKEMWEQARLYGQAFSITSADGTIRGLKYDEVYYIEAVEPIEEVPICPVCGQQLTEQCTCQYCNRCGFKGCGENT